MRRGVDRSGSFRHRFLFLAPRRAQLPNSLPREPHSFIESMAPTFDEDLARLTEAGLAAELAPLGCGLGKVAGDDVVPDLVPLGTPAGLRRRRSPRDRRRAATRQDYYA
jgi:hypothetical protein